MSAADRTLPVPHTSVMRRFAAPVFVSAALLAATVYTALADPYRPGFFPSCIFYAASGHWCPGCGGLRAVHELARGDLGAALALNPVVVLVIVPLGVALVIAWFRAAMRGHTAPNIPLWLAITVPVGLMVFWVVRNIPVLEPWLAPV